MLFTALDRALARNLPTSFLKDIYPRAMRRFAEAGLLDGNNIVETKHGFKIEANRLDAIKWYIHYFGEFEPQITQAWKRLLRPGGTVVDIGANIGYHSLLASACVGSKGRVISFEPSMRVYQDLIKNISINSADNISAHRLAVSDQPGEVTIYYAGENEQGSSSIVRGSGQGESVQSISFGGIEEMTSFDRIDLVKIDVEGAESLVIAGMMPVIDRLRHDCVLFVEVGPEHDGAAMLEPLVDAGFRAREIRNEYRTAFYRGWSEVELSPFVNKPDVLQDVVLCRDEGMFDYMTSPAR